MEDKNNRRKQAPFVKCLTYPVEGLGNIDIQCNLRGVDPSKLEFYALSRDQSLICVLHELMTKSEQEDLIEYMLGVIPVRNNSNND